MPGIYLAASLRLLVNIESLNMAETVGNLQKHKRAPIVVPMETSSGVQPVVVTVPVVSGQSIAHGYQETLAQLAMDRGLPVCPLCAQGVFVKHASMKILERLEKMGDPSASLLKNYYKSMKSDRSKTCEFERKVVESCVVEDVGGFLFAEAGVTARRTSRIEFSYMMPAAQHVRAVGMESVLHARQDPGAGEGQMLFSQEVGSALYTMSFILNVCDIGVVKCSLPGEAVKPILCLDGNERRERVRAAIDALIKMFEGLSFGAKRSRVLPAVGVESIVVTVSRPNRFMPSPGHYDDYIVETVKRAAAYVDALKSSEGSARINIFYYVKLFNGKSIAVKPENCPEGGDVTCVEASSLAEALGKARDLILSELSEACGLSEACSERKQER